MKSQTVITKKRRGPAPTGKGTLIGVRLQPNDLAGLDKWIDCQPERMTRPEALRSMLGIVVEMGLATRLTTTKTNQARAASRAERAKELAGQAIDKLRDPAAHPVEHAQRRHRLTKGPQEFREARVDRPKAKN